MRISYTPQRQQIPSAYSVILLSSPGGAGIGTLPSLAAINKSAMVVGDATNTLGNSAAFRWILGNGQELSNLGGLRARATAVNDAGVICGSAITSDGLERAVVWIDGLIQDLGSLSGSSGRSMALAIGAGCDPIVYGHSMGSSGSSQAVRWIRQRLEALPFDPSWASSEVRGVGTDGRPFGIVSLSSGPSHSVLWTENGHQVLQGLPGHAFGRVIAGHANGEMVGFSSRQRGPGNSNEAVYFNAGSPAIAMAPIPGTTSSRANGVNVHGVAVGSYTTAAGEGVFVHVRSGGGMVDLTSRLAAGSPISKVVTVSAINEDGLIVGIGELIGGGREAIVLLPN